MTEARRIIAGPAGSVVMTRVGGREYPQTHSNQCKTCNSPYRTQIENALLKSYGYTAIVNSLPEDADLNVRNITEHFKRGHLPIDESVRRVLIEEDARERGLDIEGYESTLGNHVTLAKLGIQKVLQRMMTGELEPDLDHGISFANLLLKVNQQAGEDIDKQSLTQGFMVYMSAAQQVCSPEQFRQITSIIAGNPIMQSLMRANPVVVEGQGAVERTREIYDD